jgi:4-amino-4-deoxy-L-arabinose transferase-like glycosyltransferase
MAIYLLVCNRWRRPLQSPWYALAAAIAAAPVTGFYLLREAQAPGYLAAVWSNDVSGRFMTALDRHGGPPWYYLKTTFLTGLFSAGMWSFAAPFALLGIRGRARQALIFALCCAGGVLASVSLSSTKLPQYALTAYPFLAIAVAVALHHFWIRLRQYRGRWPIGVAAVKATLVTAAILLAAKACWFRFEYLPSRQFYPQAAYGQLFASLAGQGDRRVVVVEKGAPGRGLPPGYAPQLRFYALRASQGGFDVRRAASVPDLRGLAAGDVLASCDPVVTPTLRSVGRDVGAVAGCVAIRSAG